MTADGSNDEQLAHAMDRIWAQHEQVRQDRIAALERASDAARAGKLASEQRRHAEQEAHKLAGSLGSFGLDRGSRLALEAETLLRGDRPIVGLDALRLSATIAALGREVASGPPGR